MGASLLLAEPQQAQRSTRSSQPGTLLSVSLLLRRGPARQLVDALRAAPVLGLPSPQESGSSGSGSAGWAGVLDATVVDTVLAGGSSSACGVRAFCMLSTLCCMAVCLHCGRSGTITRPACLRHDTRA